MTVWNDLANEVINGDFGELKKPFIINRQLFDYDTQTNTDTEILSTTALKLNLTKSEFEAQNAQLGDFKLIFTDAFVTDVDNCTANYNGLEVDIVSVMSLPSDAAQVVMARVK